MNYYHTCTLCGAHLDPCETCDCESAPVAATTRARVMENTETISNHIQHKDITERERHE